MKSVQNQAMMKQKSVKNQSRCTIEWSTAPQSQWLAGIERVKNANLLQSFDYGVTLARLNNQRLRYGVISIEGTSVGLVQILEIGILKNTIHAVILDRGPIWFEGHGSLDDFKQFLECLSREFPKRIGRRIRFIPEVESTQSVKTLLQEYGYKPASQKGYQTIWLDLRSSLEELRTNLKSKWRNMLRKAEKQGLEVVWSDEGKNFSWLMTNYERDKRDKGYDGASLKTLVAMAGQFSRGKNMLIGTALLDNEPIAAIMLLNHGKASTYQIGYTSETGRQKCAHHLLLWSALQELKERGINDFDLGGVNGESAKGVKTFKEGMGGRLYETPGLYH
ncbi:MAG: lipid II:glycine glycyltransferase FemX [Alphaproteobacteria bacterium]